MSETRDQIIDIASRMVRSGGYHGFSFRVIATEIGIKSASVHHHFATKERLAQAVAEKYAADFMAALGQPSEDAIESINRYSNLFIQAFRESGRACLCGILSHESPQIPDSVKQEVTQFVEANVAWLNQVLGSRAKARTVYSTLEGAMGVAALTQDPEWLDDVAEMLQSIIK